MTMSSTEAAPHRRAPGAEFPLATPRRASTARRRGPLPGARVQREAQTSLIGSGEIRDADAAFPVRAEERRARPQPVQGCAGAECPPARRRARGFRRQGRDHPCPPRPGRHPLRARAGARHQVVARHRPCRRHRPLDERDRRRVAVVPGRNAIGIELPNAKRETVYLREILASRDFETTKAKLALALGKTINGEAVIVDIAKMPHVLVAGTTGSGKSVAINTMILSLLYRMTPAGMPADHDRPEDARALRL